MTQKSRKPRPAKLHLTTIIEQVSSNTSLNKAQSSAVVKAAVSSIIEQLRGGTTVGLPGLGTFKVVDTKERQGVRPGTGERLTIPAGRKVNFKVASTLKEDLHS